MAPGPMEMVGIAIEPGEWTLRVDIIISKDDPLFVGEGTFLILEDSFLSLELDTMTQGVIIVPTEGPIEEEACPSLPDLTITGLDLSTGVVTVKNIGGIAATTSYIYVHHAQGWYENECYNSSLCAVGMGSGEVAPGESLEVKVLNILNPDQGTEFKVEYIHDEECAMSNNCIDVNLDFVPCKCMLAW